MKKTFKDLTVGDKVYVVRGTSVEIAELYSISKLREKDFLALQIESVDKKRLEVYEVPSSLSEYNCGGVLLFTDPETAFETFKSSQDAEIDILLSDVKYHKELIVQAKSLLNI